MKQKYYLSTFMKAMMIFIAATGLFSSAVLILTFDIPGAAILFIIGDAAIIGVVIWRIRTPLVEISETGMKVGVPFLFKKNTAKWDEIEGMITSELNTLGFKEKTVKILLKAERSATKEIIFSLKAVEKADEIVAKLREKIPEVRYNDVMRSEVLQTPSAKPEVKLRGWILTEAGIKSSKETIPWEEVKAIKYQGLVIAGYGSVTVTWTDKEKKEKSFIVRPVVSEQYRDFIRYLIQHSLKASIDPGLLKVLEYAPKDARADLITIFLFLIGFISFFVAMSFIARYSPTIASSNIYPLITVFLGLFPMSMTIKLILGRYRGKAEPSSKKLLWSMLISISSIVSVFVFFVVSPFSYYWMMGNMQVTAGNLKDAESYYDAALGRLPESKDIIYELGKLYREREDWEKALDYLERAYTQDPSYWGPNAVVLIPDTLMRMGSYDEALKRCKEILKEHPDKLDIARAISKKQDEIISEMDRHK